MQAPVLGFLDDKELDSIEQSTEKEACIRLLIEQLNSDKENGMEYVIKNPRFQVTWRKACRLFGFFNEANRGKCSVSNIEAFQEMVAMDYPKLYERLSNKAMESIEDIKAYSKIESSKILNNPLFPHNDRYPSNVHIGPVELLERIGVDGIDRDNNMTRNFFLFFSRVQKEPGYLPYFNAYIREHFQREEDIRKFLGYRFSGFVGRHDERNLSISYYLDGPTILTLLSRIRNWDDDLFRYSIIDCRKLVEIVPEEFLKLVLVRGNKNEINRFYFTFIRHLISDPRTSEDTVWGIVTFLDESIIEKYGSIHGDIKKILVSRFPKAYLEIMEQQAESLEFLTEVNSLQIVQTLKIECERNLRNHPKGVYYTETFLDALKKSGLGKRVITLLFKLNIKHTEIQEIFESLAQSHPRELILKISSMKKVEVRSKGNIFDELVDFRKLLFSLAYAGSGKEVLKLLEGRSWYDLDIRTHIALWSKEPSAYLKAAQKNKFDLEKVLRIIARWEGVASIEELAGYILHQSGFQGSYNDFLRANDKEAIA